MRFERYVSLPNFTSKGQTVAETWRLFNFKKYRSTVNLDFQNCEIVSAGMVQRVSKILHHAKVRADWSNRGWNRCIRPSFDNIGGSNILLLLLFIFITPKQHTIIQVNNTLGLKMPIQAPKSGFLGFPTQ